MHEPTELPGSPDQKRATTSTSAYSAAPADSAGVPSSARLINQLRDIMRSAASRHGCPVVAAICHAVTQ
eukprot:6457619-Amphidinium_carterae.4